MRCSAATSEADLRIVRRGTMATVSSGEPVFHGEEPTFVARFLLDSAADTARTVANVDVLVDLPDGSSWSLTIFTVDEVRQLLTVWRDSGEVATAATSGRPTK